MTIEIHGVVFSPPCRLVYMTLDVLGIQYKSVYCHPFKGMNKTPEFLKLNPQHNIPVLVDGKLVINESRAIATYLADMAGSYGGNSQLYPTQCSRDRFLFLACEWVMTYHFGIPRPYRVWNKQGKIPELVSPDENRIFIRGKPGFSPEPDFRL